MVGAVEYKLFVGSLNKQATEKEVEEVCKSDNFSCPFRRLMLAMHMFFISLTEETLLFTPKSFALMSTIFTFYLPFSFMRCKFY